MQQQQQAGTQQRGYSHSSKQRSVTKMTLIGTADPKTQHSSQLHNPSSKSEAAQSNK
jgi:hypothetical protein